MDRDRVVGYLAAMTDAEYRTLSAEARGNPLTPEQQRRASLTAKAGQLWDITQRCTDGNGYSGIADAVEAHGGIKPPELPQPEPVAPQQGFQINRAQGAAGGSDFAPINERDLNTQKIAQIRAERGL